VAEDLSRTRLRALAKEEVGGISCMLGEVLATGLHVSEAQQTVNGWARIRLAIRNVKSVVLNCSDVTNCPRGSF
jgi:hypothetical protein